MILTETILLGFVIVEFVCILKLAHPNKQLKKELLDSRLEIVRLQNEIDKLKSSSMK